MEHRISVAINTNLTEKNKMDTKRLKELAGIMENDEPDVGVIDKEKTKDEDKVQPPRRYHVVLHNDDYTPAEFVSHLLSKHFRLSPDASWQVMLRVHRDGKGIIATFPKDVAETKADAATQEAKAEGYPTLFTADPED